MKAKLLLLILLLSVISHAQRKEYYFKEVAWKISLPSDFNIVSNEENTTRMKRGAKAIKESSGIDADLSELKTLITATKSSYNYFTATITPFNPKVDGNYDSVSNAVNGILAQTFFAKMKDAVVDTATSLQRVGGLTFSGFRVTVTTNGKRLFTSYLLHRLHKGYDFGISYLCMDDETLKQIEAMLKESSFTK